MAAKLKIVGKEAKLALAKIAFNVLLPCNGLIKIATGTTAEGLQIFRYVTQREKEREREEI